MGLKEYQIKAVERLLSISKRFLEKNGTRTCVLKAPTGSGKTIMIAEWLSLLAQETMPKQYAFIWISGNNLHKQSKEKLQAYLRDSRYTLSFLENVTDNEFAENEIIFVNWHSLTKQDKVTSEYTNIFMRDNEDDRNLQTFVNNTKEKGREIILIVDESHYHYWSAKSQDLVQTIIAPSLILEVSATPFNEVSAEQRDAGVADQVTVRFDEVVAEGMIKKEVIINAALDDNADFTAFADDVILNAAIQKRQEIKQLYEQNGIQINPLLLIQLPSEGEKTSVLDESKMEQVMKFLKETHNITIDNGKLGIWLSEEKENLENIERADNLVEVLIFKQAIALGWDCPRAHILVMFREIRSRVFEVQTVGRILRMPEAKHYDNVALDRAYVYTNIDRIAIKDDNDSKGLFQIHPSHRKPDYKDIKLPSIYLKRIDFGEITLKFRKIFREEANKRFKIEENDLPQQALQKADVYLDLKPSELGQPVIVDALFTDIDNQTKSEITGASIRFAVSEDEIKHMFVAFAKLVSLPFAPAHSSNRIQMAIYDWFDKYLGYQGTSRLDIQRIVVCSEINQRIFREIIEAAKIRFGEERRVEINTMERKRDYLWDVPLVDYFNENYSLIDSPHYVHDTCYVRSDRSDPEKAFEKRLNESTLVTWWYKNGIERETCFAVEYEDPKTGILRAFYPDFIVLFTDGTVGIYDTKEGITADSEETKRKSDALQKYIKMQLKTRKIKGDIVQVTRAGVVVYENETYDSNTSNAGWKQIEL